MAVCGCVAGQHAPGQGIKDREKQYVFDRAFDHTATNQMVYKAIVQVGTATLPFSRVLHCSGADSALRPVGAPQGMIRGVLRGLNATVFAYGATGSGKTHTMVSSPPLTVSASSSWGGGG